MASRQLAELGLAVAEILEEYSQDVEDACDDALDDAAEQVIKKAQALSPADTGEYARSWGVKSGKQYPRRRYVGNTKTVKGKKSDSIPLINILEYSPTRKRPHINKIVAASKDGVIAAIVDRLKG